MYTHNCNYNYLGTNTTTTTKTTTWVIQILLGGISRSLFVHICTHHYACTAAPWELYILIHHPSQHALLSTPQKKFMQTLSFGNFRLILAQRLINHTFWCLFTQRVAPLQAQVADKHVEGTSQVFFYLEGLYHLCCLQGRSESQQLPAKGFQEALGTHPSFFLTYAAHGVLLCPGCLCETFGCEWSLFGGSILDARNFMKFHLTPSK